MCGSMVNIQSAAAEIRRGKKKIDRKKPQGKNIMSASAMQVGHNKIVKLAFHSVHSSIGSPKSVFINSRFKYT